MAVTQAQIAELAGVSRGTVDRTLNNRGRVDPEVAERIRKIANELGYQRNRAGSLLVRSKRPVKIGVIVQSVKTPFMQQLLMELEAARHDIAQQGAELLVRTMENVDFDGQMQLIDELEKSGIDGLALTPVEDVRICDRIDALSEKIPVVTFNTDMPGSRRLCYVGQDNYMSGRACAGLMNILLGGTGTVLMITGYLSNQSHQRRIDGFRSEMLSAYPGVSLLPLERCEDNRDTAYAIVNEALDAHPEINGIYLSANGPSGACDAVRERGLHGKVHIICHDTTEENIGNVRAGLIDFLIDQNARAQAVRPLSVLLDYILTGVRPADEYMLTHIDIRNRYNV